MNIDNQESVLYWIRLIVDFGIISYLIYKVLSISHGTKASNILKGVVVLLFVWVISGWLGLSAVRYVFGQVLLYGLLGLIVIFQPELRKGLEQLGKKNIVGLNLAKNKEELNKLPEKVIDGIVKSCSYMSKRRIGALICIEMSDSLEEFIKTGIPIDSVISEQILENIFTPNVPLHDGALIIKQNRITAASCYLPLSNTTELSKELGTRHRASLGLAEQTDALVIVVSEETGAISLVRNGRLHRDIGLDNLRSHLELLVLEDDKTEEEETSQNILYSNVTMPNFLTKLFNKSGATSDDSKMEENVAEVKEDDTKDEQTTKGEDTHDKVE